MIRAAQVGAVDLKPKKVEVYLAGIVAALRGDKLILPGDHWLLHLFISFGNIWSESQKITLSLFMYKPYYFYTGGL